jgi:hypothetical protein
MADFTREKIVYSIPKGMMTWIIIYINNYTEQFPHNDDRYIRGQEILKELRSSLPK